MRIVLDTEEIIIKLSNRWYCFDIAVKNALHIKNPGFYIQLEHKNYKGCPRCESPIVELLQYLVGRTGNGICSGIRYECLKCGQIYDVYPNVEEW